MPAIDWSTLLAEQIPRLRRYARALARDPERADDLVQDCLERAWSRIHRWQPDTDLRAWLFTIMHNLHANMARRFSREPEQVSLDDHEPANGRGSAQQEQGLVLRDLQAGLDALPAEQREVLMLVCLEEMSYEQVAQVLGIPIGTVMSRLYRARERLRRWMAGERTSHLRRVK